MKLLNLQKIGLVGCISKTNSASFLTKQAKAAHTPRSQNIGILYTVNHPQYNFEHYTLTKVCDQSIPKFVSKLVGKEEATNKHRSKYSTPIYYLLERYKHTRFPTPSLRI